MHRVEERLSGGDWAWAPPATSRRIGGVEIIGMRPGLAAYFGVAQGVLVADAGRGCRAGPETRETCFYASETEKRRAFPVHGASCAATPPTKKSHCISFGMDMKRA